MSNETWEYITNDDYDDNTHILLMDKNNAHHRHFQK